MRTVSLPAPARFRNRSSSVGSSSSTDRSAGGKANRLRPPSVVIRDWASVGRLWKAPRLAADVSLRIVTFQSVGWVLFRVRAATMTRPRSPTVYWPPVTGHRSLATGSIAAITRGMAVCRLADGPRTGFPSRRRMVPSTTGGSERSSVIWSWRGGAKGGHSQGWSFRGPQFLAVGLAVGAYGPDSGRIRCRHLGWICSSCRGSRCGRLVVLCGPSCGCRGSPGILYPSGEPGRRTSPINGINTAAWKLAPPNASRRPVAERRPSPGDHPSRVDLLHVYIRPLYRAASIRPRINPRAVLATTTDPAGCRSPAAFAG